MLSSKTIGEGPTTIYFLHWLSGSGRSWDDVTDQLSARFRCVAIDLPGFGLSADIEGYTVREMADEVIQLIRSERPQAWMMVGHSMGAKVAAVVARQAEDGLAGLEGLTSMVLLAGSTPGPEPMEESRREEMQTWFAGSDEESRSQARKFLDRNLHQQLGDAAERAALDDMLRMNRGAWLAWLAAGSREDWSQQVGILRTPALLVAGAKDPDLGEGGQRALMLPHFANATVKVLAKTKHLLPMEAPEAVADLIELAATLPAETSPAASLIPTDYLDLIESDRVSPHTRSVLLERGQPDSQAYEPKALRIEQLAILRTVAERVIPQQSGEGTIDLAARVDRELAAGEGNGWRYDLLPPDAVAWRAGLQTLEAEAKRAHKMSFCALSADDQDALLKQAAAGKLGGGVVRHLEQSLGIEDQPALDGEQMQRWFEEVRAELVRAYVAHPATLARMGYSGIADGADAATMQGFVQLGMGQREPWEPVARGAAR